MHNFENGTLVVLDRLDEDKIKFTTQKGIFNLISNNLGRIYRHYLDDDDEYGTKKNEIIGFDPNGKQIERQISYQMIQCTFLLPTQFLHLEKKVNFLEVRIIQKINK